MSTVQAVHAPAERARTDAPCSPWLASRPDALPCTRSSCSRPGPSWSSRSSSCSSRAVAGRSPIGRGRGDCLPARGVRLRRGPPVDHVDAAYCRPGRDRATRTSAADGGPVSRLPRALRRGVCGYRLHVDHAVVWPPVGIPASAHVASFRDEPDLALVTAVLAMAPVATLGGPLAGVAVARWAPFRGSALLGVVMLLFATPLVRADGSCPSWNSSPRGRSSTKSNRRQRTERQLGLLPEISRPGCWGGCCACAAWPSWRRSFVTRVIGASCSSSTTP